MASARTVKMADIIAILYPIDTISLAGVCLPVAPKFQRRPDQESTQIPSFPTQSGIHLSFVGPTIALAKEAACPVFSLCPRHK
jgi:hypothetical protein